MKLKPKDILSVFFNFQELINLLDVKIKQQKCRSHIMKEKDTYLGKLPLKE